MARQISSDSTLPEEQGLLDEKRQNLSRADNLRALEYIVANKGEKMAAYLGELIAERPDARSAQIINRHTPRFDAEDKNYLLDSALGNLLLLFPDKSEFQSLPRAILRSGAQRKLPAKELENLGESALLLRRSATSSDVLTMQKALGKNPDASGVWCALFTMNRLNPAHLQIARSWLRDPKTVLEKRHLAAMVLASLDARARHFFESQIASDKAVAFSTSFPRGAKQQDFLNWYMARNRAANRISLLFYCKPDCARKIALELSNTQALNRSFGLQLLATRFPLDYLKGSHFPRADKRGQATALRALIFSATFDVRIKPALSRAKIVSDFDASRRALVGRESILPPFARFQIQVANLNNPL